ncbi:peptidoglycan endopeptidase [Corallococcus sp. CA053C]|uniref:C40 family peptidase n=1 Tax=Corallococcus sp. CA053C TaxID=2316732 RepID=UPI000EA36687|nr:NlpC/P60 family protein [Corallococcus sp. CA053C]RKH03380.1 peptidoglycan endopeptidase [Corallococcus sp. CA053C]
MGRPFSGEHSQSPEFAVPIITSQRAAFLALVLAQMHSPYRWGAKGTPVSKDGPRPFDCSGLVTWAFHQVGGKDWRATHNTDRLWAECAPVASAADLQPGDLVLYGKAGDPDHVMVHVGAGVVVGASGGGSKTLTLEDAKRADAKVKSFTRVAYRPDVLGFRRLPFVS